MHDKREEPQMPGFYDIYERIKDVRANYNNVSERKEYDELPDFTSPDSPSSAQSRRVWDEFSTLLIVYGEDGSEWSSSPLGNRFIRRECPRKGWFHKHEYVEILYVIEGSFEQILLGEKIHFEQGEFVITDQNCEHADYIEPENAAVLFLQISADYLEQLLKSYDGTDEMQRFLFHTLLKQKREQSFLELKKSESVNDSAVGHLLELLVEENLSQSPGYHQIRTGLLLRLLQYMCRDYTLLLHSDSQEGREKALLYELEYYIHQNFASVTTRKLEEQFHYHRNYYNLLIRKYKKMSFCQYVIEVRMRYARQLLEQTALPVKKIAQQVGYENISHFYHLFEEQFGRTPKEVREGAAPRQLTT